MGMTAVWIGLAACRLFGELGDIHVAGKPASTSVRGIGVAVKSQAYAVTAPWL